MISFAGNTNHVHSQRGSHCGTSFAECGTQLSTPPLRTCHETVNHISLILETDLVVTL